jgi:hypothetical protein
MRDYILSFIIGSSILSYMLWILSLKRVKLDYYNFNGYVYYMITPFYFGIMNVLSLYFSRKFKLTKINRLLITSIISSAIIITLVYYFKIYNWKNNNKKYLYPLMSLSGHLITYFIIIYILESLVA